MQPAVGVRTTHRRILLATDIGARFAITARKARIYPIAKDHHWGKRKLKREGISGNRIREPKIDNLSQAELQPPIDSL
jgi:hypothetical protein